MFAAQLFAFFTAGLAIAGSAFAEPVAVPAVAVVEARAPGSGAALAFAAKRQDNVQGEVLSRLQTFQSTISPILDAINAAKGAGDFSFATHAPKIQELTAATETLNKDLQAIQPGAGALARRQSDDQVAAVVATVLKDITGALNGLLADPLIAALLPGLDAALAAVLRSLEFLLANVLRLVAVLLVDVARLLRSLAFGLTLAAIGL